MDTLKLQKPLNSLAQYLLKRITAEVYVVPILCFNNIAENTLLR